MKKIISIALALVIMISVVPMGLFTLTASAEAEGYYTYSVSNGEATITGVNTSISGSITIPSTLGGYPVTSIGEGAFYYCESLTSIVIPDSVTSIGEHAFDYCTSLTSIVIPDSVTSIGSAAFVGTPWYDNQPDGSVYAGKVLYNYKGERPETIIVKDGTLGIAEGAFSQCYALTSIVIPDSVTIIENDAFSGCSSLTSITIPDSVTSIGDRAFEHCTSLKSVTIGNSVTSIGTDAFYDCYSLESVTIGNSVTSIGDRAFYYCESLRSITIPDSVTSIGAAAFYNCESFASIVIPDSVTSIGERAFYYCYSLTTVNFNATICTTMGSSIFYYCENLKTVNIGDNVTKIPSYAFSNCDSLTSVTIGNSVTSIGEYAFSGCDSLQDVWYVGSESDRENIDIDEYGNEYLTSATWHYNCCMKSDTKEHVYDDDYDAECNNCGATREVPERVVIGDVEIDIMPDEELPRHDRVETKYILGWKNPDGSIYDGLKYIQGLIADYVETLMMNVKYQLGTKGNAIRYIASVDETERYESVGWLFSLKNENPEKGGANVTEKKSKKVYNSIYANGHKKTASDIYGGANYSKYLYVFEITDIPESAADSIIYVRPYVEMKDGTIVYGDVSSQTLNGLKARSK